MSVAKGDGGIFRSTGALNVCLAAGVWPFEVEGVRSNDEEESLALDWALRPKTVGMWVHEDCALLNRLVRRLSCEGADDDDSIEESDEACWKRVDIEERMRLRTESVEVGGLAGDDIVWPMESQ